MVRRMVGWREGKEEREKGGREGGGREGRMEGLTTVDPIVSAFLIS